MAQVNMECELMLTLFKGHYYYYLSLSIVLHLLCFQISKSQHNSTLAMFFVHFPRDFIMVFFTQKIHHSVIN